MKEDDDDDEIITERVQVFCRFRPTSSSRSQRLEHNAKDEVKLSRSLQSSDVKTFTYDSVLSEEIRNAQVYALTAQNVVEKCVQGYNGTIFAYGQTGSGKTYTMFGNESSEGVVPRTLRTIFSSSSNIQVNVSYVQIYCEMIQDLLDPNNNTQIFVRESERTPVLEGASRSDVSSFPEALDLLKRAGKYRTTALTKMNATSSRSHAVVILRLTRKETNNQITRSRLLLCDLAGSERVSRSLESNNRTSIHSQRFHELKAINLSLSALGNCISALASNSRTHVPFRDSKLTRLLQGSLGGNSRTALILTVSPLEVDFQETISTLEFGSRAMNVPVRSVRYRDVDYRALYDVLRKRYDRTESTIAELENIKSKNENEIRDLKESLSGTKSELSSTQAQRDALERRADQLMNAIRDMSSSSSSPLGGPEVVLDNTATEAMNPNQVLEDLRQKWNTEIKRLRDRIDTQNERNRHRVMKMESHHARVVNELKSMNSNLELTLRQEREAQLETLRDFARHREQSFEQEKDRDRRVAELLGELEVARETESRLRDEIEEMDDEQDEIDEDRVEELANARAKVMLQEMLDKDFVGRPTVEKMESLYDDVVKKLKGRVERLEKREKAFRERRKNNVKSTTERRNRRKAARKSNNAVRMRYVCLFLSLSLFMLYDAIFMSGTELAGVLRVLHLKQTTRKRKVVVVVTHLMYLEFEVYVRVEQLKTEEPQLQREERS
ncbi:hypothetical protein OAV88_03075 [bacterium]|nr:hypothetical protein [bacterium]